MPISTKKHHLVTAAEKQDSHSYVSAVLIERTASTLKYFIVAGFAYASGSIEVLKMLVQGLSY